MDKNFNGRSAEFSWTDNLLLSVQDTEQWIEHEWQAYCHETGTSLDDVAARAVWMAYDPTDKS